MNNQHTNVILYCRVSTDDQALGFSLMNQENTLKSYCKNNRCGCLFSRQISNSFFRSSSVAAFNDQPGKEGETTPFTRSK